MAEVWPWVPQALNEVLEFETDVKMARSAEWRDSFKDATQFLTLTHTLQTVAAEKLIAKVKTNALGEWLVPEWPNVTVIKTGLAMDEVEIPVDIPAAYTVGQFVFVGFDENQWEQGTVASIETDSITLEVGLTVAYAGSAIRPVHVAPMALCVAPGGVNFQSTYSRQSLSAQFMAIEPQDLSGNAYPLHAGLPVVTDGAVAFQPLSGGMNQAGDLFSSGFGAYALQEVETYTRRRGTISWYDKGSATRWARRQFIHFLRGRDGAFWLPTGQKDLVLVNAVSSGVGAILVRPTEPNAAMVGRRITLSEGNNSVTREVLGASSVGNDQLLTIAAPGVAFSVNAVVSLTTKSRLDSDQVALDYFFAAGGLASTCVLPTVEVP